MLFCSIKKCFTTNKSIVKENADFGAINQNTTLIIKKMIFLHEIV